VERADLVPALDDAAYAAQIAAVREALSRVPTAAGS